MTKFTTFKWFDADTLKGTAMEEPKEPIEDDFKYLSNLNGLRDFKYIEACQNYNNALELFESSFIEFDKEEDKEEIYYAVWDQIPTESPFIKDWKPIIGKNYTLEGVEVEIEFQSKVKGKEIWVDATEQFYNLNSFYSANEFRKVARIKKQQYGMPTNFENVKVFADGIKEETQEELWIEVAGRFLAYWDGRPEEREIKREQLHNEFTIIRKPSTLK